MIDSVNVSNQSEKKEYKDIILLQKKINVVLPSDKNDTFDSISKQMPLEHRLYYGLRITPYEYKNQMTEISDRLKQKWIPISIFLKLKTRIINSSIFLFGGPSRI